MPVFTDHVIVQQSDRVNAPETVFIGHVLRGPSDNMDPVSNGLDGFFVINSSSGQQKLVSTRHQPTIGLPFPHNRCHNGLLSYGEHSSLVKTDYLSYHLQ